MSLKDFQFLCKLGEGAYSSVFKVKRLVDNQIYAIKKVKLNNLNEHQKQNALNEVRILASIQHPNVISYQESFIQTNTNFLYIVMEFADNGDLYQKIKNHITNQTKFKEEAIWSIVIQVARGLKQLHDLKIIHRDLKSANVFMFSNGAVKIGDMNVSKEISSKTKNQTGTPYYASPEVWKGLPCDMKSDLWSLGCIIYELIALKHPFRANDMQSLSKKVTRGYYTKIPSQYSQQLNIILKMLLQVTPHLRASCDKILELPIVKKHMSSIPRQMNFPQDLKIDKILLQTIKYEHESKQKMSLMMPKARYQSTIDTKKQGHKIVYEQQQEQMINIQQKSIKNPLNRMQKLPKIHQTRKQKVYSEIGLTNLRQSRSNIINQLLQPLKRQDENKMKGIKNNYRLQSQAGNFSQKYLPFLFQYKNMNQNLSRIIQNRQKQKEKPRIKSLAPYKDQ